MPDPQKDSVEGITLTFSGDTVTSSWYHPDLAPVICALCEKGETCKERHIKPGDGTIIRKCTNANPFCG